MADLSPKAKKLLEMVRAGYWLDVSPNKAVTAMWGAAAEELVQAGLICRAERVAVTKAAFVPTTDYTPYVRERFGKPRAKSV